MDNFHSYNLPPIRASRTIRRVNSMLPRSAYRVLENFRNSGSRRSPLIQHEDHLCGERWFRRSLSSVTVEEKTRRWAKMARKCRFSEKKLEKNHFRERNDIFIPWFFFIPFVTTGLGSGYRTMHDRNVIRKMYRKRSKIWHFLTLLTGNAESKYEPTRHTPPCPFNAPEPRIDGPVS